MTTDPAGVILIGWPQLLLATSLVLIVGVLSWRLRLGLEKDLAIATVRTFVQLLLLGFVLRWGFGVSVGLSSRMLRWAECGRLETVLSCGRQ